MEMVVLSNGIRLAMDQIDHVRSFCFGVFVNVGSCHEKPGKEGLAHFVEHMLFKGTKTRTRKQITDPIEKVGGVIQGTTHHTNTYYRIFLPDRYAERSIEILADMILNPLVKDEDIQLEKKVVLEELEIWRRNQDNIRLEKYSKNFWPGHSIGRRIGGYHNTVMGLQRQDILDFMGEYYTAKNVILSAAGNFDRDRIIEYCEKHFSNLPAGENESVSPEIIFKPQIGVLRDEKANVAVVKFGVEACGFLDERFEPMRIAAIAIGGSFDSILFEEIREKRGLAYSVGGGMDSFSNKGVFEITVQTKNENVREVVDIIREQLYMLSRGGLTEEVVEDIKLSQICRTSMNVPHPREIANLMPNQIKVNGRLISLDEVIKDIEEVCAESVNKALGEFFGKGKRFLAILGNMPEDTKFDLY